MVCSAVSGLRTLRHDLLKESWRRIASRAGVATSIEPRMHALRGAQAARIADAPGSRGDIVMNLNDGLSVADVAVVHPAADSYLRLAQTIGGAASDRDKTKIARYRTADPNGYKFVPLSVESYGRWGKPAMELLNTLASKAADDGVVAKDRFVTNALRELSVTLCRGNGQMYRRGLNELARVSGIYFRAGLTVATSDVI